jgi:hypothetical protein
VWRIVFSRVRKRRYDNQSAGPWLATRESAEYWLGLLKHQYPDSYLQDFNEAYPHAARPEFQQRD